MDNSHRSHDDIIELSVIDGRKYQRIMSRNVYHISATHATSILIARAGA